MNNNNSIEAYIKNIKGGFIDREHYWSDLPIPQNWEQYISYPNDECPSFLVKNYWQVFIDHPDPKKRYGYDPDHDFLLGKEDIEEDSLQFHNPYWNVPPRFTVVPYDWGWLENSENWDHHHIFYVFPSHDHYKGQSKDVFSPSGSIKITVLSAIFIPFSDSKICRSYCDDHLKI